MTDQRAKSLRWLANQFPAVDAPKDDTDRISTCIHLYCTAGADAIDTLTAQLAALQAENAKKDGEITKLKLEKELMRQEWDESQAALSRVEVERDAAIARINKAYEIAWGCDIPSPTVPEYVELHGGMTRVMTALRGAQGEG